MTTSACTPSAPVANLGLPGAPFGASSSEVVCEPLEESPAHVSEQPVLRSLLAVRHRSTRSRKLFATELTPTKHPLSPTTLLRSRIHRRRRTYAHEPAQHSWASSTADHFDTETLFGLDQAFRRDQAFEGDALIAHAEPFVNGTPFESEQPFEPVNHGPEAGRSVASSPSKVALASFIASRGQSSLTKGGPAAQDPSASTTPPQLRVPEARVPNESSATYSGGMP